jgi:acetyl esterase/lipase
MQFKHKLFLISICFLTCSITQTGCLKQTFETNGCNVKTFFHSDPVSVQAQSIIAGANLINVSSYSSILEYDSTKTQLPEIPNDYATLFNLTINNVSGRKVVYLQPKSGSNGKVILWFHGGGYAKNISPEYYDFFAEVVNQTGSTLVMPDYGLAPYYNYLQGYALMKEIYDQLVGLYGADHVIVAGDSAGGGFALGFTQKLKIDNQPLPHQLLLLFPWLDVALSNPDMENIHDIILNPFSLRQAGLSWAGPSNTSNYMISPINGSMEGLPPVSLFIGGRDMFLPDAIKLKERMEQNCSHLHFYEYPHMFHGWMVLFKDLPESKLAIQEITTELKN